MKRTTKPARTTLLAFALGAALAGGLAIAPVEAQAAEGAQRLVDDARKKLRERDVSGAIRALEAAIEVDGKNADAHILYQDNAMDVLGPEEVATKYRRLASENPEDPLYGFLHARLLPAKDSLAAFDKMSKKFKESPWPFAGRARALERMGRFAEAIQAHDEAVALGPKGDMRFRAYQAYTLERASRFTAAVAAWQRVLETTPKDRGAQLGFADSLRRSGDLAQALTVLDGILKKDPKDTEARYRKALALVDSDKYEDALKEVEALLQFDKGMVEALAVGAEAALRQAIADTKKGKGQLDEKALEKAVSYAERAVASDPDSGVAHYVLGAILETLGELDADKLEEALEEYDAALDLIALPGPDKVRVMTAKAYVLLRLARYEDAMAVSDRALEMDPANVSAMCHGGHALTAQGKAEEAIKKYYKPALKLDKEDARVRHGIGTAYWDMKKHNDAMKQLKLAVKYDPASGRYRLSLGEIYFELRRYKDAVKELFEATEHRPNDVIAWAAFGRACTAEKYYEDAIEAYEKVVELDPESIDDYLYLAILYDRTKDEEKARENIIKFLENGGNGEDGNLKAWIDKLLGDEGD